MTTRLRSRPSANDAMTNWNQFNRRNLWQHQIWADFQKSIGRKTWFVEVEGASVLIVQHKMPFGLNWLEIPRGPLFENEKGLSRILSEIDEIGKKEQSVFVRMSPYQVFRILFKPEPHHSASSSWPRGSRRQDSVFGNRQHDHHPQSSLILDIAKSDEDILKQMKPKGRYNIKVAQKHNVTVKPSEDADAFYALLQKTGGRDGFGIHLKSYYKKMLESLGDHVQLLLAEYEGRVISGGIFVYLDEWGIYYYGASDYHYRNVMAPYLVQWEAIREAKRRGCSNYDFLGIAPENIKNHPWAGVTAFKRKFGGRVVEYPQARELVLRRFWYWAYRLYKRFL